MATVTISLPKSLKELIDHHVLTKGYGNVSEYFRTLLRGAQQVEADARVEALLLEGLGSGDDVPLTREFWTELKTEARQIAEAHLAKKAFVNSAIRPRARVDIIRQFRWYLVEQDTSDTAFLVAASSGDTIEVCPALYPEQLVITKPVTLLGLS